MKLDLTLQEQSLLQAEHIAFEPARDYTEEEALNLLERVREVEVEYSQGEDAASKRQYQLYSALGDRLFNQIPED